MVSDMLTSLYMVWRIIGSVKISSSFFLSCRFLYHPPDLVGVLWNITNAFMSTHMHRLEALTEFWLYYQRNMKFELKKRWRAIAPHQLKNKSAGRFCLFPKSKSDRSDPRKAPVFLNVYDLTPMNGYVYWAGLGIFHSGVEGKLVFGLYYLPNVHCVQSEPYPLFVPGFVGVLSLMFLLVLLNAI